jgi:mono/diheme cytochrome c family protein
MSRLPVLLLSAAALAAAGCDVIDPMMVQQKVVLYRPNGFYEDGIPMRPPPPGTVAREDLRPPEVETGVGPDGKPLARIPLPVDRATLEVGQAHFDQTCAACHGVLGDGRSPVARNMSIRPPPSLHLRVGNPDGWFYQVISEGYGLMPSYAPQLTVEERWAVVAYLRALQLSQRARVDLVPASERERLERTAPGGAR